MLDFTGNLCNHAVLVDSSTGWRYMPSTVTLLLLVRDCHSKKSHKHKCNMHKRKLKRKKNGRLAGLEDAVNYRTRTQWHAEWSGALGGTYHSRYIALARGRGRWGRMRRKMDRVKDLSRQLTEYRAAGSLLSLSHVLICSAETKPEGGAAVGMHLSLRLGMPVPLSETWKPEGGISSRISHQPPSPCSKHSTG